MAKLTQIQKTQLLPQAIEHYLSENNATQVALAQLAGIDKAYVNQLLKGAEKIGKAIIADKYYEAVARAIGFKLEKNYWQHLILTIFKLLQSKLIKYVRKKNV